MKKYFFVILALCIPFLAAAEEEESAGSGVDDEGAVYETVVSARREPEPPFKANRSISAVDSKKLSERSPRTTPEALRETTGVFVQQTNQGGGSPILRGLVGPQVLILVDGVRLNNSIYRTGPNQYLNMIDIFSIERIEVLRGPGSVLYGSDAIGGVMNVFPVQPRSFKHADLPVGGKLNFRFASANLERSGHAQIEGGYEDLSLFAGGTYRYFDDLRGGRDIGYQAYSGYQQASATGALIYRFSVGNMDGWFFKTGYLFNRADDVGRTDKLLDARSLQIYDNDSHLVYGRLRANLTPIKTVAEYTLSYQDFFERKDAFKMGEDLVERLSGIRDNVWARTLGNDLQFNTHLADDLLRLVYGAMWYHDWVGSENYAQKGGGEWEEATQVVYPEGSTYDNYGAFLSLDLSPVKTDGGHEVVLSGGYRLHGMRGFSPGGDMLNEAEYHDIGHVFSAGLQYLFMDNFNASFTFMQGFRSPNLQESVMIGDTGKSFHIPNPELKPERSDTLELVLRGRYERLYLGWTGYVSYLSDLIKRVKTDWKGAEKVGGKIVEQNVNGQKGIIFGAETEASLELFKGLTLSGGITYTWGEERGAGVEDKPLTRIPPMFGTAKLRYEGKLVDGKFNYFGETYILAAGKQMRLSPEDVNDVRIPDGGTPGWFTWNLRGGLEAYKFIRFTLGVENILDEEYKYHGSGVYGAGTSAIATLELSM